MLDMVKRLVKCAADGCKEKFSPRVRTQVYCSQTCKNREAQRRYAQRQSEQQNQQAQSATA